MAGLPSCAYPVRRDCRMSVRTRFVAIVILVLFSAPAFAARQQSTCFGTSSHGRLEGGIALPKSGLNFSPYSSLGVTLGRTYVHSRVATTISAAYQILESRSPEKIFVYGESGSSAGGTIKPHRTHQNGLAVDFMVPVVDSHGKSVPLPTGLNNEFGYSIE
ncbi:MAG: penicillin-insensitive murein endopeptidase, partial [Dokdonella sp.]